MLWYFRNCPVAGDEEGRLRSHQSFEGRPALPRGYRSRTGGILQEKSLAKGLFYPWSNITVAAVRLPSALGLPLTRMCIPVFTRDRLTGTSR
jgi:hypothetical protein